MPIGDLLSHPAVYRLWQSPFAAQKLKPVVESGRVSAARRVLDLGCGPGTNARSFDRAEAYVGIDLSEAYVAYASKHFSGDFRVADVTVGQPDLGKFDLVLMNSLMHHLDDVSAGLLLSRIPALVAPGGEVQIIDLVLAEAGLPRRLAPADRGAFPRSVDSWREMVSSAMQATEVSSFHVGLGPLAFWELVHVRAVPSEAESWLLPT